jgi:prevent-host-death family protein
MDYIPEIITVSAARQNLYRLVDQVDEGSGPVVITGKHHKAVLISEAEWNAYQETMYLSSIPGLVKSIKKAAKEPLSKAVKAENIKW